MRNTLDIMRDLQIAGTAMNAPLLLEAAEAIAALNAENNALMDMKCALVSRVSELENGYMYSNSTQNYTGVPVVKSWPPYLDYQVR